MIPVRIWLQKYGAARFISHLDWSRAMARALRRASLPIWYTEGFNPHPYLTFPLPLSLGVTGMREPMDIRLIRDIPLEDVTRRLAAVLPEGIAVLEAAAPVMPVRDIAFAVYQVDAACPPGEGIRSLTDFMARPAIVVTKKSKSGQSEIDLKPHLRQLEAVETQEGIRLSLTLPAGARTSINPALVTLALESDRSNPFDAVNITRCDILNAQMESFR